MNGSDWHTPAKQDSVSIQCTTKSQRLRQRCSANFSLNVFGGIRLVFSCSTNWSVGAQFAFDWEIREISNNFMEHKDHDLKTPKNLSRDKILFAACDVSRSAVRYFSKLSCSFSYSTSIFANKSEILKYGMLFHTWLYLFPQCNLIPIVRNGLVLSPNPVVWKTMFVILPVTCAPGTCREMERCTTFEIRAHDV